MKNRTIALSLATLLLALNVSVESVHAESTDTMLVLMPHCTEADRTACPSFTVADPTTLATEKHAVGDIIDLDIVLRTLKPADVATVRAWLSYDINALEARSVELSTNIRSPLPGEQTIEKSMGIVKIGASVGGKIQTSESVIARVTFRILNANAHTFISFHHYLPGGSGETAVNGKEGTGSDSRNGLLPNPPCFSQILGCKPEVNALLAVEPSKLQVTLLDATVTSAVPVASAEPLPAVQNTSTGTPTMAPTSINPPTLIGTSGDALTTSTASSTAPARSSFTLLQVQNLRATTRDRDVYIGWMPLRSSELKGYNVYYSTVSGRYAQRHSLPATAESYTIRDLEPGTTYFIAVRAFNQSDIESAFSQEVSVSVGHPETSTAPLSAVQEPTAEPDGNPISTRDGSLITGETGTSSVLFIVFAISAGLGTILAFHRQLILHRTTTHV